MLPAKDIQFLTERGFDYELVPDPAGVAFLIIHGFDVTGGGFKPSPVDLMIRVPAHYPTTPLDMWYCDPAIRIASTGQFAQASENFENHLGRKWQRFSRHLNGASPWRPGIDRLRSFFTRVQAELQGKGKK